MLAVPIDTLDIGGLSIAGIILVLAFRTFWQQGDGWRAVLAAAREDAKDARTEAEHARTDASAARKAATEAQRDASLARDEARRAQDAEGRCQRRLARVEADLADMRAHLAAGDSRLDHLESDRPSGEIPAVKPVEPDGT